MHLIRNSVLISLAAVLPCLATAQENSPTITYSQPAAPLATVLADLSKQTGMVLLASPSVASDVVVLNLKGVTVAETMKRLASVLHAEWTQGSNNRYTLTRTQGLENKDRQIELAERVAAVQKAIANQVANVQQQGKFDDEAARKMAKENKEQMDKMLERAIGGNSVAVNASGFGDPVKTPAGRVITKILSQLSAGQLATMLGGNRVVFSTSPTRMQYGLPGSAVASVQQFVNEQRIYADAQKQNEQPDGGRRIMIAGGGDSNLGDGDPRLGMGVCLLTVDPAQFGRSLNVRILVTDRNGGTLATGSMAVPFASPKVEAKQFQFQGEKPIQLSGLAAEFAKAIKSAGGSAGGSMVRMVVRTGTSTLSLTGDPMAKPPIPISKELRERILNPEKFEPQALAPGEGFAAVTSAWGKNLVAYLPDGIAVPLTIQLAANTVTPSQLLSSAQTGLDMVVATDGDWMTVEPRHPASARARHIERAALGKYLRAVDAQGYSRLDDLAAFALAQPKQIASGDVDFTYLRLINTGVADQALSKYAFSGGWGMMRFYATLSPGQRQALGNGQSLPLANLTTFQMDLLADQVFNSFDGPVVQDPQRQPSEMDRARMFMNPSLAQERTIVLPTGIMRNGFLNVRTNSEPAVQAMDSHTGSSGMMTAAALAWAKLQVEKPEMFGGLGNSGPAPDKYRMASQSSYSFIFTLAPNVTLARSLEDGTVDRNAALVAYDSLPGDFRQKVDAALSDLRNMNFGVGGIRGGAGRPPNP